MAFFYARTGTLVTPMFKCCQCTPQKSGEKRNVQVGVSVGGSVGGSKNSNYNTIVSKNNVKKRHIINNAPPLIHS